MPVIEKLVMKLSTVSILEMPVGHFKFNVRRIESSNIDWIGWPQTGQPLLVVQFKGGETRYAYIGVSRQRAVACAYAKSSGEYLNHRIKPFFEAFKLR